MAVLTINGKDCPAQINMRSSRLFEERTGIKLAELMQSAFSDDESRLEIPAAAITAAVWALVNAKRSDKGPEFDDLEELIDIAALPVLFEQVVGMVQDSTKAVTGPLAEMSERMAQRTGSSSGPTAVADSA